MGIFLLAIFVNKESVENSPAPLSSYTFLSIVVCTSISATPGMEHIQLRETKGGVMEYIKFSLKKLFFRGEMAAKKYIHHILTIYVARFVVLPHVL